MTKPNNYKNHVFENESTTEPNLFLFALKLLSLQTLTKIVYFIFLSNLDVYFGTNFEYSIIFFSSELFSVFHNFRFV